MKRVIYLLNIALIILTFSNANSADFECNKVLAKKCLKSANTTSNQALKPYKCAVKEQELLGSWVRVKGDTTFEEMNFSYYEGQRTFESWIHHAPEMSGKWEIENCVLHIYDPNQNAVLSFDLMIKKLEKGKLYLFDTDVESNLVYQFYP